MSEFGLCSRREADRRIEAGRVTIDGDKALMGQKVLPGQRVFVDGKEILRKHRTVFLMLNKPPGIVCTSSKDDPDNIIDFIGYPERVYTVGRLDKDSRGLILLTNEGETTNRLLKTANFHEKEYRVTVDSPISDSGLEKLSAGMYLEELEKQTLPCKVSRISDNSFSIILTQGLNRQIRRMCAQLGYTVIDLFRVRFLTQTLGDLPEGEWRELTEEEIKLLSV